MNRGVERLRVGIVAPEFPPAVGGMETLALGFATALGADDAVTVVTAAGIRATEAHNFRLAPILNGSSSDDVRSLRALEADVDVWLMLNGGLIPLVPELQKPAFAYLHGNDFLKPWLGYGSWWLEGIRKPYMAELRHRVRRRAVRRALPSVRHVFTNSAYTAALASEHLALPPERITVCQPGVDDRFFQKHEPADDRTLRLLTVTRLTKYTARKNVDGVLAALPAVRRQLAVRYTVVGDGDDRARLELLARDLGLSEAVSFAGTLSAGELLAYYRRSDLFVLAAKATSDDVEGFGIVYLEAAASGVPAICSREGGAVSAVQPGRNGIVIPGSAPADIAAGILEFARDRGRYAPELVAASVEASRWAAVAARLRARMKERLGASTTPAVRPAARSVADRKVAMHLQEQR
jgi:phosphatidylinositol alpha-1,6-mannosyltransferase